MEPETEFIDKKDPNVKQNSKIGIAGRCFITNNTENKTQTKPPGPFPLNKGPTPFIPNEKVASPFPVKANENQSLIYSNTRNPPANIPKKSPEMNFGNATPTEAPPNPPAINNFDKKPQNPMQQAPFPKFPKFPKFPNESSPISNAGIHQQPKTPQSNSSDYPANQPMLQRAPPPSLKSVQASITPNTTNIQYLESSQLVQKCPETIPLGLQRQNSDTKPRFNLQINPPNNLNQGYGPSNLESLSQNKTTSLNFKTQTPLDTSFKTKPPFNDYKSASLENSGTAPLRSTPSFSEESKTQNPIGPPKKCALPGYNAESTDKDSNFCNSGTSKTNIETQVEANRIMPKGFPAESGKPNKYPSNFQSENLEGFKPMPADKNIQNLAINSPKMQTQLDLKTIPTEKNAIDAVPVVQKTNQGDLKPVPTVKNTIILAPTAQIVISPLVGNPNENKKNVKKMHNFADLSITSSTIKPLLKVIRILSSAPDLKKLSKQENFTIFDDSTSNFPLNSFDDIKKVLCEKCQTLKIEVPLSCNHNECFNCFRTSIESFIQHPKKKTFKKASCAVCYANYSLKDIQAILGEKVMKNYEKIDYKIKCMKCELNLSLQLNFFSELKCLDLCNTCYSSELYNNAKSCFYCGQDFDKTSTTKKRKGSCNECYKNVQSNNNKDFCDYVNFSYHTLPCGHTHCYICTINKVSKEGCLTCSSKIKSKHKKRIFIQAMRYCQGCKAIFTLIDIHQQIDSDIFWCETCHNNKDALNSFWAS